MKISDYFNGDVNLIIPDRYPDHRGFLKETYNFPRYLKAGVPYTNWVTDIVSVSKRGTLRGMHFQPGMAKLVQCLRGRAFDVIIDMRKDSSTYGEWQGFLLDEDNDVQVYVPENFAHGFLALSETVIFNYKISALHNDATAGGIHYSSVGIQWPKLDIEYILTEKDKNAPVWNPESVLSYTSG
jgi:dTDP-4-dehydrorhamnose 3,5-epimerase